MATMTCFVCSLPFPDTEARYAKGKPVCPQCQNVVGTTEVSAPPAAAGPAPAASGAPRSAAPKVSLPVGGGKLYFEHSGTGTVGGAMLMTATGAATAIGLGYAYAWLSYWNPFIYFTVLATIGYALAMGFSVAQAGKFMDSRSLKLAAGIGALSGLIALWWSWAAWLQAAHYAPGIELAPGAIFDGISRAAAKETWTIKGITFEGAFITVFWFLEALVLLGLPCLYPLVAISSAPFCERCGQWLPEPHRVEKLAPILHADSFRGHVESGDFSIVASLQPLEGAPKSYTRLEVSSCPSCLALHVFSAVACTVTRGEDGEDLDEESVVDLLLVNKNVVGWVKRLPGSKY